MLDGKQLVSDLNKKRTELLNSIAVGEFKQEVKDSPKPVRMEPGFYMRENGSFFELTHDNKIINHGS